MLHFMQTLPTTTTHLLHQKTSPRPRFDSPARSLPPHLRSYRNFTQTALLAMNSSQPEEVLAESWGQIPDSGRIPARRSSSMIRGSKSKGEALPKGRAVSAQPALRFVRSSPLLDLFDAVVFHAFSCWQCWIHDNLESPLVFRAHA